LKEKKRAQRGSLLIRRYRKKNKPIQVGTALIGVGEGVQVYTAKREMWLMKEPNAEQKKEATPGRRPEEKSKFKVYGHMRRM